jgi:hypothetical protein
MQAGQTDDLPTQLTGVVRAMEPGPLVCAAPRTVQS